MKTFKWAMIRPAHPFGGEYRNTLLETYVDKNGESCVRFWAILDQVDGGFSPIIITRNRNGYQTILETLSLEDAQLAVEKRLLDVGVMEEGDLVLYDDTEIK